MVKLPYGVMVIISIIFWIVVFWVIGYAYNKCHKRELEIEKKKSAEDYRRFREYYNSHTLPSPN